MINDEEDNEVIQIYGVKLLVRLPENAGPIVGICRFRDKLIIASAYGGVFQWDDDKEILQQINL